MGGAIFPPIAPFCFNFLASDFMGDFGVFFVVPFFFFLFFKTRIPLQLIISSQASGT